MILNQTECVPKFEKDGEDKIDVKIDPDGGISKDDGDKSFDNKEETVEDFVKSSLITQQINFQKVKQQY